MRVYRLEDRWDPLTGEPTDPEVVFDHERCELTGDRLRVKDVYPAYVLDYDVSDACSGRQGGEEDFFEELGLVPFQFLSGRYTLGYQAQKRLLIEATANARSFADALRFARIQTTKRLVAEGEIDPKLLDGSYTVNPW